MGKRYSILHVPVLSFYNKSLYRDVCLNWKHSIFFYLLLLMAICTIPFIVTIQLAISDFVENDAPDVVSQIPNIYFDDGKASINETQPYAIYDPDTGEILGVIDTTGSMSSLSDSNGYVLITETDALLWKSEVETRTFSFQEIDNFTFEPAMITHWLDVIKKFMAPAFYPVAVLGCFIGRLIQVLVYAAIGLLFASWCKSSRTYVELVRLAIVAVTPPIVIKTLFGLFDISLPAAGLWYFLIAMGYLYYGIKASSANNVSTTTLRATA